MNRDVQTSDAEDAPSSHAVRAADCRTQSKPGRGRFAWNSSLLATAAAVAFFWCMGSWLVWWPRGESYMPPVTAAPKPSRTFVNNNRNAARRIAPELDGTAVVYPKEVNSLVALNGRFRVDLTLEQIAEMLRIDRRSIAKLGSTREINPDAVLFTAVAARLTEQAKSRSHTERLRQARDGLPIDYTADEWVAKEFHFTLHDLNQPNDEQKAILEAISRSAREIMPEPGEKVRAVWVTRFEIMSGGVDFSPGYLPLESAPDVAPPTR